MEMRRVFCLTERPKITPAAPASMRTTPETILIIPDFFSFSVIRLLFLMRGHVTDLSDAGRPSHELLAAIVVLGDGAFMDVVGVARFLVLESDRSGFFHIHLAAEANSAKTSTDFSFVKHGFTSARQLRFLMMPDTKFLLIPNTFAISYFLTLMSARVLICSAISMLSFK